MNHWAPWAALAFFALSYLLVILEDKTRIRKSLPMIIAAGVMWMLAAIAPTPGRLAEEALRETFVDFVELFLFLLPAMTFVTTLEERQVFDALRVWLVGRGLSLRALFWATGGLAFFLSPVIDNLTTALVVGAVAMSIGGTQPRFIVPAFISIVVAANAGGAFSPFGDVTTLMAWQAGKATFSEFFTLFLPSLTNWLVPATLMSFTVPRESPPPAHASVRLKPGARGVILIFLGTIAGTVLMHNFLHLSPSIGMMTGLGVLHFHAWFLQRPASAHSAPGMVPILGSGAVEEPEKDSFDIFGMLARVEWDTLMFFYGVILCVGALHALGFLEGSVNAMYAGWGPTATNTAIGLVSAVFDNIPVMAAILSVSPELNQPQWLLVVLTTGVGGSLLSVGSAAGVALMGQARGVYTFRAHLRWTWAIALGYAASIAVHLLVNGR
ncbi:MAG: sodium:proton antiporter NhaD [Gemmatimonadota bacterium]